MTEIKKITQKEWDIFIEPQFVANGFSRQIREALKAAFFNDIRDADYGEVKPFMGQVVPGITKDELMQAIKLARKGCEEIHNVQTQALKEVYREDKDG